MADLVNIIRAIVRDELRALRLGDVGVVTSAFPHEDGDAHNYECNVRLREGELELRKVPICTPHLGMASAPAVGDLVLVSYVGGDANRPIVVGRLYSADKHPPVHAEHEWRVESPLAGETSIAIDKDASVVITAGDTVVTVKKSDSVELRSPADLKIEVDGNVAVKCVDCKIDASGNIDLGEGGGGVITDKTHKCYFPGAPLVGSPTVKAKG
jgi:phage baseplate assembly protein gpV